MRPANWYAVFKTDVYMDIGYNIFIGLNPNHFKRSMVHFLINKFNFGSRFCGGLSRMSIVYTCVPLNECEFVIYWAVRISFSRLRQKSNIPTYSILNMQKNRCWTNNNNAHLMIENKIINNCMKTNPLQTSIYFQ